METISRIDQERFMNDYLASLNKEKDKFLQIKETDMHNICFGPTVEKVDKLIIELEKQNVFVKTCSEHIDRSMKMHSVFYHVFAFKFHDDKVTVNHHKEVVTVGLFYDKYVLSVLQDADNFEKNAKRAFYVGEFSVKNHGFETASGSKTAPKATKQATLDFI